MTVFASLAALVGKFRSRIGYRPLSRLAAVQIVVVATFLLALSLQPSAFAASITLAWDPPPTTNQIAGYNLYAGPASRTYTNVQPVGQACTGTLAVPPGVTYLAVTAVDTSGLESDFSNEVVYTNEATAGTNLQITITTTGTTILSARIVSGPWTDLGCASVVFTNPVPPIYFRSRGPTTNQVTITSKPF